MDDNTEIFRHWLHKVIKKDKRITGKQLAALVKCDPSTISSYIRFRTRPDHSMQEAIKAELHVTDQEVTAQGRAEMNATLPAVTGHGTASEQPPASPHRRATDTGNMVELSEHQIMVTRFKDKARGKHLNELLLEIEELDPGALDEVTGILRVKIDTLRKRTSPRQSPQDKSSAS
jgi:transcriptional regulator with XRE-family HTH domain